MSLSRSRGQAPPAGAPPPRQERQLNAPMYSWRPTLQRQQRLPRRPTLQRRRRRQTHLEHRRAGRRQRRRQGLPAPGGKAPTQMAPLMETLRQAPLPAATQRRQLRQLTSHSTRTRQQLPSWPLTAARLQLGGQKRPLSMERRLWTAQLLVVIRRRRRPQLRTAAAGHSLSAQPRRHGAALPPVSRPLAQACWAPCCAPSVASTPQRASRTLQGQWRSPPSRRQASAPQHLEAANQQRSTDQ